jgi:hypothetical protein
MKTAQIYPPGSLPIWGGFTVVISILSVHLIGLSIALLAVDLLNQPTYHRLYDDYEKARKYFSQFEPGLERRRDGREPIETELRAELVKLRRQYTDIAFDSLFAGRNLHAMTDSLPINWLVGVCPICLFLSLLMSILGANIFERSYAKGFPFPKLGMSKTSAHAP